MGVCPWYGPGMATQRPWKHKPGRPSTRELNLKRAIRKRSLLDLAWWMIEDNKDLLLARDMPRFMPRLIGIIDRLEANKATTASDTQEVAEALASFLNTDPNE
jgi:hypothetical protein